MASCMDCMPQDGVLKEEDDDIDEGTFVKRKKKRPRPVQASLRALQRQTMLDMLRATQNDLEELREEVDRNHAEIRRLQGETNGGGEGMDADALDGEGFTGLPIDRLYARRCLEVSRVCAIFGT